MTNQEKFIQVFGIDAWQQMIVFCGCAEQFMEFWTSPFKEVPTGKWIEHEPFERNNCNKCIECSVCKVWLGNDCYAKTNFCPMCGSRMVEEQQGEDT